MLEQVDFWKILAGLGLFLFAMKQLETALKAIGGRSFRNFLKQQTAGRLRSALGGVIATAMLQSSSIVGLMVLAFVGAGLMTLPNALGVIIGSNLGTTLTGWIVATVGFKLDIDSFALPFIGIGSLTLVIGKNKTAQLGRIIAGFGFLLLGLTWMKDSVGTLAGSVDIASIASFSAWQFLLFGLVLAAVIQSSSATMMITLAALHAGIINLPSAAAIAIGADLGTTTTVMIGALQGASAKKRVAAGHFIFNLITDLIAFFLRGPLLAVVAALGISDPLFSLVAFHSLFNLIGILFFLPVLKPFASLLERLFNAKTEPASRYVSQATPSVTDAAVAAINEETAHLIGSVITQNMAAFDPPIPIPPGPAPIEGLELVRTERARSFDRMYHHTKLLEGEILSFATQVQGQSLEPEESKRLSQLQAAVREAIHSTKALKDIRHNLLEFEDSGNETVVSYLDHFTSIMTAFYASLFSLRGGGEAGVLFEDVVKLIDSVKAGHEQLHREIFSDIHRGALSAEDISTLLNVNREVYRSNMSLVLALKDFHLDAGPAESVSELPGVGY